jgi:hypothetical protein
LRGCKLNKQQRTKRWITAGGRKACELTIPGARTAICQLINEQLQQQAIVCKSDPLNAKWELPLFFRTFKSPSTQAIALNSKL